jgi:hydrogenase nickel incorporation protein HypB
MCDSCGCNVTSGNRHLVEEGGALEQTADGQRSVEVLRGLLSANDHQALHNRSHLDRHQVLAINLMSSPGSGKTALLEATIDALAGRYRMAVIEGDLETENDAERIRAHGIEAIQIATGSACHLDAHMVHDALHRLDLEQIDLLFIENVGNLVCPASFDLGHHRNVTLLSVTEGDDKPAKYPVMFRSSDLLLVSKADLLAYLDDFSPAKAESNLRALASSAPVVQLSSRSGDGLADWIGWLEGEMEAQQQRLQQGMSARPGGHADVAASTPHHHHHDHHNHHHGHLPHRH